MTELIRSSSGAERTASDYQRLIDWGKQSFIDALKRCRYSQPWFDAWIRVAAHNLEHLAVALRVAKNENFKKAAQEWDKLMLSSPQFSNVEVEIRGELIGLVCVQGGKLPTVRDRTILSGRPKIAKAITRLLSLIKSDPEISKLSSTQLYTLAFEPLAYRMNGALGIPNLSLAEHRRAPSIEAILTGIVTRIEAQLPFGMIHKPLETSPEKLTSPDAQQTQFERVMIDRLRLWFDKPKYELCALLASAAFDEEIGAGDIRQRDVLFARRQRKASQIKG